VKILTALCLAMLSGAVVSAELYRWVDRDGKTHYTDTPPPASAKNVQQKKLATTSSGATGLPYAVQQAVKNFPVTLYSSACGNACTQAKALLDKRGLPYSEKNPQESPEMEAALKKVTGGTLEVPTLTVGGEVIKGFEAGRWNSALDLAGYPQTVALPKVAQPAPAAVKPPALASEPASAPAASSPASPAPSPY